MELSPFLIEPILKTKPWGGRRLGEIFGRELPGSEKIGESWELSARPADSNRIISGPFSGKSLLEAIEKNPTEFLGEKIAEKYGAKLPLLAKFIDASDHLSIQVHPDDCMALNLRESDTGKHEAWLIVEARPGATLILGTSRELSYEEIIELCEQGRHNECLNYLSVEKGDVIAVPPGTLHSIGRGIVLFEVSQNSDLTYRVDDWKRNIAGRELHRERAREIVTCGPPIQPVKREIKSLPVSTIYECEHFRIQELRLTDDAAELKNSLFRSITVLEGALDIRGGEETVRAGAGRTVFCPACAGELNIKGSGKAIIIEPVLTV